MCMSGYDDNLETFLQGFGFSEEELCEVVDELNSYRSIPGTTIERYMNRIINTLQLEDRPAFLKGLMVGIAIREVADVLAEPVLTEEEKGIDFEIRR